MVKWSSSEQKTAYKNIAYVFGKKPLSMEELEREGIAVPKEQRKEYMTKFVEMRLFDFDGKCYTLTGLGETIFDLIAASDSKSSEKFSY